MQKIADDGDDLFHNWNISSLSISLFSAGFKHTNDDDQHFYFFFLHFGLMEVCTRSRFFREKRCFIVRKAVAYFGNDREDDIASSYIFYISFKSQNGNC